MVISFFYIGVLFPENKEKIGTKVVQNWYKFFPLMLVFPFSAKTETKVTQKYYKSKTLYWCYLIFALYYSVFILNSLNL
jgi:hypothetical protein